MRKGAAEEEAEKKQLIKSNDDLDASTQYAHRLLSGYMKGEERKEKLLDHSLDQSEHIDKKMSLVDNPISTSI